MGSDLRWVFMEMWCYQIVVATENEKKEKKEMEEELLINRKIKPTAARILVLRYLLGISKAASLKDLEEKLFLSDKSTLFRTLKTFEKNKVIHSIDDGTGITKYALCLDSCLCKPEDQHYHFHCIKCEETFCLSNQIVLPIELPPKFTITSANLVIKGECANCN